MTINTTIQAAAPTQPITVSAHVPRDAAIRNAMMTADARISLTAQFTTVGIR
jgi:hypothetical protein